MVTIIGTDNQADICALQAGQRRYCEVEGEYFIKGILPVDRVDLMLPTQWPAQRIGNEYTALDIVREKTNVPVPRVLEKGFNDEFCYYLKLQWADGIDLFDIVDRKGAGAGLPDDAWEGRACELGPLRAVSGRGHGKHGHLRARGGVPGAGRAEEPRDRAERHRDPAAVDWR